MKDMANAHLDTKERLLYAINGELEMLRNRAAMAAIAYVSAGDLAHLVWHMTKIHDRAELLRKFRDGVRGLTHDFAPEQWESYRYTLEAFKTQSSEDARHDAITETKQTNEKQERDRQEIILTYVGVFVSIAKMLGFERPEVDSFEAVRRFPEAFITRMQDAIDKHTVSVLSSPHYGQGCAQDPPYATREGGQGRALPSHGSRSHCCT